MKRSAEERNGSNEKEIQGVKKSCPWMFSVQKIV